MGNFVVCVTGGIASGKTFVSDYFHDNGVLIIDADIIAREVVEINSPGLLQVSQRFGNQVLHNDGSLNRAALKQIAFKNPDSIDALNSILHPMIGNEIKRRIKAVDSEILVLVIPLFSEHMIDAYGIDRVLLVDVNETIQLGRVLKRDGVDQSLAIKMISSQSIRSEKIEFADDIIVNNNTFNQLKLHCEEMLKFYRSMHAQINGNRG